MTLDQLPVELIYNVARFLPPRYLCRWMVTCSRYRDVLVRIRNTVAAHQTTSSGDPVLLWAIDKGYLSFMSRLLESGADPSKTKSGTRSANITALHKAVSRHDVDATKLLLQYGSNVGALDATNSTPLHVAAEQGYDDLVAMLLDATDFRRTEFKTVLLRAVKYDHGSLVRCFLALGADPHVTEGLGVCSFLNRHCLPYWLSGFSWGELEYYNAFQVAVLIGSIPIVDFLFPSQESMAELKAPFFLSQTHWRKAVGWYPSTFRHLAKRNPDLLAELFCAAIFPFTPFAHLDWAVKSCYTDLVVQWLEKPRKEVPQLYLSRLLAISIEGEHDSLARKIYNLGADPFHATETPALARASRRGDEDWVCKFLGQHSAVHFEQATVGVSLEIAAYYGHLGVAKQLLKASGNVSYNSSVALAAAVWLGHTEMADVLMKAGACLHPALKVAAPDGNTSSARQLLDQSVTEYILSEDLFCRTPCSVEGAWEILQEIRIAGASARARIDRDIDACDSWSALLSSTQKSVVLSMGQKLFWLAMTDRFAPLWPEREAWQRIVVARGGLAATWRLAESSMLDTVVLGKLICTAAGEGHCDILSFLLGRTAAFTGIADKASTALHTAVRKDKTEVIPLLLQAGADVNSKGSGGNTPPLFGATANTVVLLVDAGANIWAANERGQSPLSMHVRKYFDLPHDDSDALIEAFLYCEYRHDDNLCVEKGYERPDKDAYENHHRVINDILSHRSLVNYGATLHWAVSRGHYDIVEFIARYSAGLEDPQSPKIYHGAWDIRDGDTVLHTAARRGNVRILEKLIEADTNLPRLRDRLNKDGDSVLDTAALCGHVCITKELLEADTTKLFHLRDGGEQGRQQHTVPHRRTTRTGMHSGNYPALCDRVNNDGETPLRIAVREGNVEMFTLFSAPGLGVDAVNDANITGETPKVV
ncbi:hypothetical protein AJ80_05245 [Polytolypa hystricis UAMH7299]|uniref:F-box domain-containing protein n=1 Tax=Polytolypa hystricis (strain UAMH7299) TaxID=1447883 RepID=A0A2B7Y5T1_POLH7|nr:hypothetical protein AJ80_05245 [Polytolypa hystricis UAMH7299]